MKPQGSSALALTLALALTTLTMVSAGTNPDTDTDAKCKADNCARAVTGTAKGTAHTVMAKRDCSSFMTQTVTVYTTATAKAKRDVESIKALPTYASACSGAVRYSSACSCWGLTASTSMISITVSYLINLHDYRYLYPSVRRL